MDYAILGNIINASVGIILTVILVGFYIVITPRLYWYQLLFIISVVTFLLITFFKAGGLNGF